MRDYLQTLEAMREFTRNRDVEDRDQLWFLEHPSVYTLGLNGDPRHFKGTSDDTLIRSDRGGQISWHGPGQLMIYTLIDLRRHQLGVKSMVHMLEMIVIDLLAQFGITATTRDGAPGVYVQNQKLASIGLKVSRGCCYHGLGLNVNPNLRYFASINPCGFEDLSMTSLEQLGIATQPVALVSAITILLKRRLETLPNQSLQIG